MRQAQLSLGSPMSALVWLALFVPGHLWGGRLALVLPAAVLLLAGEAVLTRSFPWESRRPSRQAAWMLFLLLLSDVVSYLYSVAFNAISTGPLDLWALSRTPLAGLLIVYVVRHRDAALRRSLESAMAIAVYYTLLLQAAGVDSWSLFEPSQSVAYFAILATVYYLFFSRSTLSLVHAASAVIVLLSNMPSSLGPLREANAWFWRSPVFGWGPASYEAMSSLGNQYLRWLLRNGALGGVLLAVGIGIAIFHLLRALWADRVHRAGAVIFCAASLLFLMSGAYLEDFRLFVVTAFLMACLYEDARP